jgi:hypothetical protein
VEVKSDVSAPNFQQIISCVSDNDSSLRQVGVSLEIRKTKKKKMAPANTFRKKLGPMLSFCKIFSLLKFGVLCPKYVHTASFFQNLNRNIGF